MAASFSLAHGRAYRAKLSLGWLERVASNETVQRKLEEAGFTAVSVWGSGGTRWAEGVWSGQSMVAELPSQVEDVQPVAGR